MVDSQARTPERMDMIDQRLRHRRSTTRRRSVCLLQVEAMESRQLLAIVTVNSAARLTAYSGVAGAAATPVLSAAGAVNGTFVDTTDPNNFNAPHVFLMGTDIVTP